MLTINNTVIKRISCFVPSMKSNSIDLSQIYGEKETLKLIASIGVNTRYVADKITTTSDLCFNAANNFFSALNWNPKDIGTIIFVSQTPDYQLPATSCILQHKLGIPETAIAFDVNLGCSGYVYGLKIASSLVNAGIEKVLFLVGDTISKIIKPGDRSTEFLFGDAGSATTLQCEKNNNLFFELGRDGAGWENIVARQLFYSNASRGTNNAFIEMNGGKTFTFTLKTVPPLVNNFFKKISMSSNNIDVCIYHQANLLIIKHLSKKSNLKPEQVPISIDEYGNPSCASIPMTLCTRKHEKYKNVIGGIWRWPILGNRDVRP